jgi:hypothetical protein
VRSAEVRAGLNSGVEGLDAAKEAVANMVWQKGFTNMAQAIVLAKGKILFRFSLIES